MLCWRLLMASERCEGLMQGQELNLYIYDPFGSQAPPCSMTLLPPYLYMYIPVYLFLMSWGFTDTSQTNTSTHTHTHTPCRALCCRCRSGITCLSSLLVHTVQCYHQHTEITPLICVCKRKRFFFWVSIKVCLFAVYVFAVFSYFDCGLHGVWSTGTKRLSPCGMMWSTWIWVSKYQR